MQPSSNALPLALLLTVATIAAPAALIKITEHQLDQDG
jgi:hypothetical protein